MAKKDGVFFVRIEDTDQKREVEDGVKQIMDALKVIKRKQRFSA